MHRQLITLPNLLLRQSFSRCYSAAAVERTALYDFHIKQNGKIVNFGGYSLPVQYADQSIVASHLRTRQHASIFDVSHMLQTYVRGKDAIACIESVCTADLRSATADGSGTLTVFTNADGGILDDLIVTRISDRVLYIVSNAAMKKQDMEIIIGAVSKYKAEGKDVSVEFLPTSERSLIAVQGPTAVSALSKLVAAQNANDLKQLYFMQTMTATIADVADCRITRCGYTGEDGVEISIDSSKVQHVTEALLDISAGKEQLKMAGLGARDSLRLEAGLCLYGSDIDAKTTPVEAGLSWLVAKRRRAELNFPGAQRICDQLKVGGKTRQRVGLTMTGTNSPPARAGAEIYHNDTLIGKVTSGCPSPSTGKNIAMGYTTGKVKSPGTAVQLKIRDKIYAAEITKMPFVKTNYFLNKTK